MALDVIRGRFGCDWEKNKWIWATMKELIYHPSFWEANDAEKAVVKKYSISTSQRWWATAFNESDRHGAQWQIWWFICCLWTVAWEREIKLQVNSESGDRKWRSTKLCLIWGNFSSNTWTRRPLLLLLLLVLIGANLCCELWKRLCTV